jgi:hypothetical protein
MAKLPQAIETPGPNGANPRGSAVDFGGLDQALQRGAAELKAWDEDRRKVDEEIADQLLTEARRSYDEGAGVRAAAYDGREPGFAENEGVVFDVVMEPTLKRTDLPDGVRDALTRRSRVLRGDVLARAITVESGTRGRRAAADRDAAEGASALEALLGFNERWDARRETLENGWDGATPLAGEMLTEFRALKEETLAAATPAVAERLRPQLLNSEAQLQAQWLRKDDEARDARTLTTARRASDQLINRATRDPAVMQDFDAAFAPIAAILPAYLVDDTREEVRRAATVGDLSRRIQAGEHEAVRAEVAEGRYDYLDPKDMQAVEQAINVKDAELTAEDYVARAELEVTMAAQQKAVINGGRADPAVAAEVERRLGPAAAAEYTITLDAAARISEPVRRLRYMSPEEIAATREYLTEKATDAVGARALMLFDAAADTEEARRQTDPASWAVSIPATGQTPRVAQKLRDFDDDPNPDTAMAYAVTTLAAQASAGIPAQQRRVLPTPMAQEWVGRLDARNANFGEELRRLDNFARLFGEYAPMVYRELEEAGLDPADLGALRLFGGDGVQMSRYVSARSAPRPTEDAARQKVTDNVTLALGPYLATARRGAAGAQETAALVATVETLAYGEIANGADAQTAASRAARTVTSRYRFVDGYRIPSRFAPETIQTGLRMEWNALIADPRLPIPPQPGLSGQQARDHFMDSLRADAYWRTLPDDTGLELVVPTDRGAVAVVGPDGRPVRRTFQRLASRRWGAAR